MSWHTKSDPARTPNVAHTMVSAHLSDTRCYRNAIPGHQTLHMCIQIVWRLGPLTWSFSQDPSKTAKRYTRTGFHASAPTSSEATKRYACLEFKACDLTWSAWLDHFGHQTLPTEGFQRRSLLRKRCLFTKRCTCTRFTANLPPSAAHATFS